MPPEDLLTDGQVAELLVKEAQDYPLGYSAMGLDALKSNKRPANQPKPNTRFLNNIIRDTNSHNRALLAKESAESKAKLRDLEDAEDKKRKEEERRLRKSKPGPSDTRKRMLGDIAAILGGSSKRRRTEKTETSASHALDLVASHVEGDRNVRREKSRKDLSRERDRSSHRTHRRDEGRREDRRESHHHQSRTSKRTKRQSSHDSSDSDPLNDIIGPAPVKNFTVHRRGRGANAATSGIDGRFALDYDPSKDVTPEQEDADDWDNAVEAFRDRQKWKQQGADRLRSAGFTEEQIKKWEKGDTKDESDVQWTKAGGLREWDRGKVVSKDGTVTLATGTE
ncbi:hypothetical protein F4813DRAFT_394534 [Daldinia decipiens]|uniref:uncharacterized protein n=1 Tax=Daldinia decipiens TaxID=326647 RepID=UPI0020C56DBF|nr:uncharacterized protein F4813DRAFT_394534 [Daldinia decipiens]KAI1652580.1 hypothetical protein F4813DRAFT_394534 [Daldinia decipiens]